MTKGYNVDPEILGKLFFNDNRKDNNWSPGQMLLAVIEGEKAMQRVHPTYYDMEKGVHIAKPMLTTPRYYYGQFKQLRDEMQVTIYGFANTTGDPNALTGNASMRYDYLIDINVWMRNLDA